MRFEGFSLISVLLFAKCRRRHEVLTPSLDEIRRSQKLLGQYNYVISTRRSQIYAAQLQSLPLSLHHSHSPRP
jgi:hypothetical protein